MNVKTDTSRIRTVIPHRKLLVAGGLPLGISRGDVHLNLSYPHARYVVG